MRRRDEVLDEPGMLVATFMQALTDVLQPPPPPPPPTPECEEDLIGMMMKELRDVGGFQLVYQVTERLPRWVLNALLTRDLALGRFREEDIPRLLAEAQKRLEASRREHGLRLQQFGNR